MLLLSFGFALFFPPASSREEEEEASIVFVHTLMNNFPIFDLRTADLLFPSRSPHRYHFGDFHLVSEEAAMPAEDLYVRVEAPNKSLD
jgi:hypothetical protein